MKRKILLLLLVLFVGAASASAQLGGIVYDPTNYNNALLRYFQLQQQLFPIGGTPQPRTPTATPHHGLPESTPARSRP
jgi:hypothetical protein